jgi:hypothetical protein
LSEEKDLNFLMKFLNFSKGLLWTEIYKRTHHLIGKTVFILEKGFFESAINLNNNDLNYILNSIDLNFLVKNSLFVKNHMDIIVNRLFSETEHIDIPESFSLELSDYILKNILQIENVDSLKLFEYKELVPSDYLFQRILNGKDMFETNKDTSNIVRFTIQHLHGNPSEFISVLNSEFLMEYIYLELNDYLKYILNHREFTTSN